MDGLEVGWLETLLKKRSTERNIARILTTDCKLALGPGENYTSDIMRMKMRVVLGSGRITKRPLIIKMKNVQSADIVDRYGLFNLEIKMYSEILPLMEELMEEHGDLGDYIWADYYGTNGNHLVFEDLQAKGFKLADRQSGQDLNHALLALRNMARFHAMSSVLLRRGLVRSEQFPACLLARNDDVGNKFYKGGIQTLADVMNSNWDPKWSVTATKLREIGKSLGSTLHELYHLEDDKFQVINHGDCWINNMLFKYGQDGNYPIGFRFVDYQCSHYNSYAWDLMYFIYSSIKPSVRRNHFEEIVSTYHRTLISTLEFYNSVPDNAPTKEDVHAEMERLQLLGLMVSCTLLPITMADPEDALVMEGVLDDSVEVLHNKNMYLNEKFTQVIQQDLEYFSGKGLL